MKATPEIVEKLFDEINQEGFGGAIEKGFRFVCTPSKRFAGQVRSKDWKVTEFQISSKVDFTEESLRNVVAHEALHVYIIQNLYQKDRHGPIFQQLADHLNRDHGFNVLITGDHYFRGPRPLWLAAWELPSGDRVMKPSKNFRKKDFHDLKRRGLWAVIYRGDENSLKGMKVSRTLSDAIRCKEVYVYNENKVKGLTVEAEHDPSGERTRRKAARQDPHQGEFDF